MFISYPKENKNKAGHPKSESYKIESSIFFLHLDLAEEESNVIIRKNLTELLNAI